MNKLAKFLDKDIRKKNIEYGRLRLREWIWQMIRPPMRAPIFVVGCSRSGTTVTYETLARAPGLLTLGYEVPQLWHRIWGPWHNGWASEAASWDDARPEHARQAMAWWWARLGNEGRLLDKTCINVLRVDYLAHLFPDAHFVFVHRDGRDNVSSLMDGWRKNDHFALRQFLGPLPADVAIENGEFDDWRFFLPPGWRDYNTASLAEVCAYQWIKANELALQGSARVAKGQWHVLRYESLFEDPMAAFKDLYNSLALDFTTEIRRHCENLTQYATSIVSGPPQREKWKQRNPEAIDSIQDMILPMQKRLGYYVFNNL